MEPQWKFVPYPKIDVNQEPLETAPGINAKMSCRAFINNNVNTHPTLNMATNYVQELDSNSMANLATEIHPEAGRRCSIATNDSQSELERYSETVRIPTNIVATADPLSHTEMASSFEGDFNMERQLMRHNSSYIQEEIREIATQTIRTTLYIAGRAPGDPQIAVESELTLDRTETETNEDADAPDESLWCM